MRCLDDSTSLLRVLGDRSRLRLLALLEREELTVAELTRITRLGQSRISTHLARLKEASLVLDRRAGTSTYYKAAGQEADPVVAELWDLVRRTASDPLLEEDQGRLRATLRARNGDGVLADALAGRLERHYLPGRSWEAALRTLLGLARLGRALDIGAGDCALAELIAPRSRSITCLDIDAAPLAAGRARMERAARISFRRGDMHALPFASASFDEVLMLGCLCHARDPSRAVAEACRVLRPGGALVLSTLAPHRHADVAHRYGHLHRGFPPRRVAEWFRAAGATVDSCGVTSRERRAPHFEVVTLHARR